MIIIIITTDYVQGLKPEKWHRLLVSRKEGGRGLASIEDSVDASIRGLKVYIKKSKERRITAANKQQWEHKDKQNSNK